MTPSCGTYIGDVPLTVPLRKWSTDHLYWTRVGQRFRQWRPVRNAPISVHLSVVWISEVGIVTQSLPSFLGSGRVEPGYQLIEMHSGVREDVHELVAEDGVVPGALEANEDLPQSSSRRRWFRSMLGVKRCGALGGQHRIEDLPAAEGCEGVGKDWVQCGDVLGGGGFVRIDL